MVSAARQFIEDRDGAAGLEEFLDHVALVTDVDSLDNAETVKVMTLHAAKGLEFPVVFMVGLIAGRYP